MKYNIRKSVKELMMQDRYTGDVGDFGKFGMLRNIVAAELKVGVNWYLTPDENHNDDGKHITYLNDVRFDCCDDKLRNALRIIVGNDNRSVSALEKSGILNAVFYSNILHSPGKKDVISRNRWHELAMDKLGDCEVVFLDPDNGLLVKSVSPSGRKSNKYVTEQELIDYYESGKSVVFYNHRSRQKEEVYLRRFQCLAENASFIGAKWCGLKFSRGTIRDYFFIIRPDHETRLRTAISLLLVGGFGKHFSQLDLGK